jgi:phosphoribosylformimino-5-aminoimidazole carboxamide ribotide isomerase
LAKRIIPCLDIADGRVVKGVNFVNLRDAGDPVEVARRYDEQGADELAFLDIRASVENRGLLYDMIEAVASQVFIPLTVGGGVNAVEDIRALLNAGADKVSINTSGVKNPGFLHDACSAFPGHILVGLDAREGKVATDGWSKMTGHDVVDLARKFEDYGVEGIIYTDIGRDGMLTGINIEATVKLAREIKLPVIASGGLSSIADIAKLAQHEVDGIIGAIAGRAIYEGTLNFKEALKAANPGH